MPRQARIVLANCPHHIIQRGHNRQDVFTCDDDYLYYLDNLRKLKEEFKCEVYAYCLMTNHVHMVINPGEKVERLGLLMKHISGRQTRYTNTLKKRTGSLWEGRYKSSPIQADEYLLACCRYIELNPVRAGMVPLPWDYVWSSCRLKTGHESKSWLDEDPFYSNLGTTKTKREMNYKQWIHQTIPDSEIQLIREAAQRGQLTGNNRFGDQVTEKTGRNIKLRGPGRPKKPKN